MKKENLKIRKQKRNRNKNLEQNGDIEQQQIIKENLDKY